LGEFYVTQQHRENGDHGLSNNNLYDVGFTHVTFTLAAARQLGRFINVLHAAQGAWQKTERPGG
jgi:hypothetical protein